MHLFQTTMCDPSGGAFVVLGKISKGLTDATLMEQTELLRRLETARDRHTVYVRPEAVVEDGMRAKTAP